MPTTERSRSILTAIAVGLLGFAVSVWASWRPSFWYDEAATVSATNRPFAELGHLVAHTDAVHALYYVVMHVWSSVFGYSEFALRFPSSLAVGVAAGLMVPLGERLWDKRFGVVAGLVLLCLPRTLWAGAEARSYAGTLCLAVAATLMLFIAVDRGRWWWAAYAVVSTLLVFWFFLGITLLAVHLAILLYRRALSRGFVVAAVAVGLIVLPFARWALGQRGQIAWIPEMSWMTLRHYARFEFFVGSWVSLSAVTIVSVLGVLVALLAGARGGWGPAIVGVLWVVVPTIVVLGWSWLVSPVYVPRYLIFTLPGLALVVAWALIQVTRGSTWFVALGVGVLAASAVPSYLEGRGPYGRMGGTDYSAVADYIAAHAQPGDCVAFARPPSWSPVSQRVVLRAKPDDFAGLRDIGPSRDPVRAGVLWDGDKPVTAYRDFAASCAVVWVLTDRDRDRGFDAYPGGMERWHFAPYRFTSTPLYAALRESGLHIVSTMPFNNSQVVEMRR